MQFALNSYMAELERAEGAYRNHFGALAVLTRDKWSLIERFFDTVVSKSREVFSAAERDTEAWIRSLLPPLEVQVREQRSQLRKRAESVARIRDAQESLDERIGQLEEALEDVQTRLTELKLLNARCRQLAERDPGAKTSSMTVAGAVAAAAARRHGEKDLSAYLRVEI